MLDRLRGEAADEFCANRVDEAGYGHIERGIGDLLENEQMSEPSHIKPAPLLLMRCGNMAIAGQCLSPFLHERFGDESLPMPADFRLKLVVEKAADGFHRHALFIGQLKVHIVTPCFPRRALTTTGPGS